MWWKDAFDWIPIKHYRDVFTVLLVFFVFFFCNNILKNWLMVRVTPILNTMFTLLRKKQQIPMKIFQKMFIMSGISQPFTTHNKSSYTNTTIFFVVYFFCIYRVFSSLTSFLFIPSLRSSTTSSPSQSVALKPLVQFTRIP